MCCSGLADVELHEGLEVIGERAFACCPRLRSVTKPSSVTELDKHAFSWCSNLARVELPEGLKVIGPKAFGNCWELRIVTIPRSVVELGGLAFGLCRNLSEVIFFGGERLLNREILDRRLLSEEEGLLNQEKLNELIFGEDGSAFNQSPLTTVKISTSWVLSERMAGLPRECRPSFETAIRELPGLELMRDGTVLACFPVASGEGEGPGDVRYTTLESTRSLHRVWVALYDLRESSILMELAMMKDCQVPIPGPAKSAIFEYCGFTGFL